MAHRSHDGDFLPFSEHHGLGVFSRFDSDSIYVNNNMSDLRRQCHTKT